MNELCDTQYIAYELANEKYAIKICEVFEIIKYQTITTVYNSKAYLEGVINLRGKIIPVVNLHKRIGIRTIYQPKPLVLLLYRAERIWLVLLLIKFAK